MLSKKQILTLGTMLLILVLVTGCGGGMGVDENKGTVSGKVTDQAGKAIEGVTVNIVDSDANNVIALTATTDANGNYEIKNVVEGSRNVAFRKIGYQTYSTEDPNGDGNTSDAAPVTVIRGNPTEVNAQLTANNVGTVNVSVKDAKGNSLKAVIISAFNSTGTFAGAVASDLNGKATLGLPAGTYTIKYTKLGYAMESVSGVTVNKETNTDVNTVALPVAAQIGNISVKADLLDRNNVVTGGIRGFSVAIRELNQTITTDALGAANTASVDTLRNLPVGEYHLTLTPPTNYKATVDGTLIALGDQLNVVANVTASGYSIIAQCQIGRILLSGALAAGRGLFISKAQLQTMGFDGVVDNTRKYVIRGDFSNWQNGSGSNAVWDALHTYDTAAYEMSDGSGIVFNFDDMIKRASDLNRAAPTWEAGISILEFPAAGGASIYIANDQYLSELVGDTADGLPQNYGIAFTQSSLNNFGVTADFTASGTTFVARGDFSNWANDQTWGDLQSFDVKCVMTTDKKMLVLPFASMIARATELGGGRSATWDGGFKVVMFPGADDMSNIDTDGDGDTENPTMRALFR